MAVVSLVALADCGRGTIQAASDAADASSTTTATADVVAERSALPSCGEYQTWKRPPEADAADGCLLDAFATGRPAELILHSMTIEGDPVDRYLRVLEKERVEVIFDGRRDQYGGRLQHDRCWTLTARPGGLEASNCKTVLPPEPPSEPRAAGRAASDRNDALIASLPTLEPAQRIDSRMTKWPDGMGLDTVTRVTFRLPAGTDRCTLVTRFEDALASKGWSVDALETPDLSGTGNIRWADMRHGEDRVVLSITPAEDTFALLAEANSTRPTSTATIRMPCGIGPK